jgi:FkbM family methyltransferase
MKVFVDCGFHHGEGLKEFASRLHIDNEWRVHCFEPNPECFMSRRLLSAYDFIPDGRLTLINIVGHSKAVWTHDGNLKFSQENIYRSDSGSPTDGKSAIDGWRSRVYDLCSVVMDPHWVFPDEFERPIDVECIDFSKWISFFKGHDVYCKMDIEGSEFVVLRKILRDGNAGIFKKLWIEFHTDEVPGESLANKNFLISELSKFTEVAEWH